MFGSIGPWELILILFIALIIFGPGKLPSAGQALGKAIREFRKATNPEIEIKNPNPAAPEPNKEDPTA